MDTLSRSERSERMARIRGRDTKPELLVRRLVHRCGFRYRLHRKMLPGKPDLVFPSRKKVIFVHGCFWHSHGCRISHTPKSNADYWGPKLERNVLRDQRNIQALRAAGWSSFVIWECETDDEERIRKRIVKFLNK